jgi:hypothetical protein
MRGVRWYLVGSLLLAALAGCKQFAFEEREPWRHDAEESCLKAGNVRQGPGVVLIDPISGPGVCGADYPLKIGELGEGAPLGYGDEEALRPPGDVPRSGPSYPRQPSYPAAYPSDAPAYPTPSAYPADERLPPDPYRGAPTHRAPSGYPASTPFAVNPAYPADTRLPPRGDYRPSDPYEPAPPYPDAPRAAPRYAPSPYPRAEPNGPVSLSAPGIDAPSGEREGDYQTPLPRYGAPRTVPAREAVPPRRDPRGQPPPFSSTYPGGGPSVPMSSARMASVTTTASVSPPATLACPIVSALDRWISDAVQPAAMKWFGQPVTGIKQISAYSCRGMNGNPNAHISEHAFGNALDIASFILADGRVVTVEKGWRGAPEEQGFLRDVQADACDLFTTVLAPGSNVYHYNHIHVDLMRRASGRRICQPAAVPGDMVASRARIRYGGRDSGVTGSIGPRHGDARHSARYSSYGDEDRGLPDAVPGAD